MGNKLGPSPMLDFPGVPEDWYKLYGTNTKPIFPQNHEIQDVLLCGCAEKGMYGVRIVVPCVVVTSLVIITMEMYRLPATSSHFCQLEELPEDRTDKTQFITHGKWMPEKKHYQRCELKDETKCCRKGQNLHFEFYNKYLNKVDAVEEFRRKLRNKRMLLLGDSLMFEFFEYLVAFLRTNDPKLYKNYSSLKETLVSSKNKMATLQAYVTPADNSSVTLLPAHLISLEGQKPFTKEAIYSAAPDDIIRKEIANHDVILFNQGIHYREVTMLGETAIHFNNMGQMLYGKENISGSFTLSEIERENEIFL